MTVVPLALPADREDLQSELAGDDGEILLAPCLDVSDHSTPLLRRCHREEQTAHIFYLTIQRAIDRAPYPMAHGSLLLRGSICRDTTEVPHTDAPHFSRFSAPELPYFPIFTKPDWTIYMPDA